MAPIQHGGSLRLIKNAADSKSRIRNEIKLEFKSGGLTPCYLR